MTALIAVYTGDGCAGRCDAKCYNAWGPECHCICQGANHGADKQEAIDNTREMAESWFEGAPAGLAGRLARRARGRRRARAPVREGTVMQSVKWPAGGARRPGARLIWASTAGLAVLAAATFYVSFRAQFTFMYAVKHQDAPALIEALIADVAMVVCSLLALGMACAGQSAKVARLLVVLFAALSAGMNYLAADVSSVRSVAVYVMPPVVFAVCTDQTVAVIRRHGLGIQEDSAWSVLGRVVLAVARLAGVVLLYGLRFVLAPAETAKGLRRMVLTAAPIPETTNEDRPATAPGTLPEAAAKVLPQTAPEVTPRPALEAVPDIGERSPVPPGKAAGTGDPGAPRRVLRPRPRRGPGALQAADQKGLAGRLRHR